jgi:hypothetical protein
MVVWWLGALAGAVQKDSRGQTFEHFEHFEQGQENHFTL